MTNKEALDKLVSGLPYEAKHWTTSEWHSAIRSLLELVLKDTPKKIKHENNGIPYCTVCERSYLHDTRGNQNNFCGYCGQRINWGE